MRRMCVSSEFLHIISCDPDRDTRGIGLTWLDRYIPDGNSKFGAVEITSPPKADQSLLRYRLFVNGEEAWSYTITTPPDIRGGGRAKDAVWG